MTNTEPNNGEIWKTIPALPYQISSFGNVARIMDDETRRPMKTHLNQRNGHRFVVMHRNGVQSTKNVRALVAQAFLDPPKDGDRLQFRDKDKGNCAADNLYWRNVSRILLDYIATCDREPSRTALTEELYQQVRELWATGKFSQVQIGRMVGISNSTVSKIVNNKSVPKASFCKCKNVIDARPEVLAEGLRIAAVLELQPYQKGTKEGPLGRGIARATEILRDDPTISISALAREMGVSRWAARDYMTRLKHQELVNAIPHQECTGGESTTQPGPTSTLEPTTTTVDP